MDRRITRKHVMHGGAVLRRGDRDQHGEMSFFHINL
jgi:hypothetical protein